MSKTIARLAGFILLTLPLFVANAESIRVRVVNPDGTPVNGARVVLTGGPEAKGGSFPASDSTTLVTKEGRVTFGPLTIGRYVIVVKCPGYLSTQVSGIEITGPPARRGVDEVVITLNPIVELSPYEDRPKH